MPFTNSALDAMLDTLNPTAISLHTADPGSNGANEVAGGAYARQPASFNPSVSRVRALSNNETFSIPGGTTVTHAGVWAGATFIGSIDLTDETFTANGTYTLLAASTSLTIANA